MGRSHAHESMGGRFTTDVAGSMRRQGRKRPPPPPQKKLGLHVDMVVIFL